MTITRAQTAVAHLVSDKPPARKPRQPGNCKRMLTILADDDEHLRDFAEYMG